MRSPVPALLFAALLFAGCTDNAPAPTGPASAADARSVRVEASDTACTLSAASAPSGTLTFSVTNTGTQANEFYLLADDGQRVVGEVEDIGAGITRDLVVSVPAGDYLSACKPALSGKGIRAAFTVTPAD